MDSITLRLQPSTKESLEREAEERGVSRSEYIRNILRSRHELERLREQVEELERENERLSEHVTRLEREKRLILEQREENTTLQRYAETERAYREAGLKERLKWWLWGREKS